MKKNSFCGCKESLFLIVNPEVIILTSSIVHLWYKNSPVWGAGDEEKKGE